MVRQCLSIAGLGNPYILCWKPDVQPDLFGAVFPETDEKSIRDLAPAIQNLLRLAEAHNVDVQYIGGTPFSPEASGIMRELTFREAVGQGVDAVLLGPLAFLFQARPEPPLQLHSPQPKALLAPQGLNLGQLPAAPAPLIIEN
jgi:hypothetical protein